MRERERETQIDEGNERERSELKRKTVRDFRENVTTLRQMREESPVVMRSTPLPLFSAGRRGTQGVSCFDEVARASLSVAQSLMSVVRQKPGDEMHRNSAHRAVRHPCPFVISPTLHFTENQNSATPGATPFMS